MSFVHNNLRHVIALVLLLVGLLVSLAIASNTPVLDLLPDDVALFVLIPLALAAIFTLVYALKLAWEAWRS